MLKNNRKGKDKNTKVLKLNLSATMMVAGIIVFIIIAIIAVKMIATAINSNSQKAMAEEETQGYTMVDSTELGEDGNPIQVPVPDGFTASQVPGETTVNGGFVIYEGEVDWGKIEDLDSYTEVDVQAQAEKADASMENSNLESINSENSEEVSTESNNADSTRNSDSNTTNESSIEEVEEEQTQDVNSKQEDSQENVVSGENEIAQNQIDETDIEQINQLNSNKETEKKTETNVAGQEEIEKEENIRDKQQIEEETNQEIIEQEKQVNNAIVNEEEPISNEEAGIVTLAEGEIPTTVFELQTSVNQYVWVPVKDVSRIYGIDSNGKIWGKLYSFAIYNSIYNWSEVDGVMTIKDKSFGREPDIVPYIANTNIFYDYDKDSELQSRLDGIEQYQMLSQEMEKEFYKMIENIKQYGGFYIGRYETGNLSQTEVVVQKMNEDIDGVTWYEMYEKCKGLVGKNENIETSMIWGSLWDETLRWLVESEAKISTGEIIDHGLINDSTNWGNYKNATFEYTNTGGGINTKNSGSITIIPTGSTDYTKANNIYDMAGNICDWTLEAAAVVDRVHRGGNYTNQRMGHISGRKRGKLSFYQLWPHRVPCSTLYKITQNSWSLLIY